MNTDYTVSIKEAANELNISEDSVWRLCNHVDPLTVTRECPQGKTYLECSRPVPRTMRISRASLDGYKLATQMDQEFWEKRREKRGSAQRIFDF